jgi:isocitrate lyase
MAAHRKSFDFVRKKRFNWLGDLPERERHRDGCDVGSKDFDEAAQIIAGGESSTTALLGSTEAEELP